MLEAADKSHDAINALASNPEVVSLIQNGGDNMEKLTKTIGPIASDISRKEAWAKAKSDSIKLTMMVAAPIVGPHASIYTIMWFLVM